MNKNSRQRMLQPTMEIGARFNGSSGAKRALGWLGFRAVNHILRVRDGSQHAGHSELGIGNNPNQTSFIHDMISDLSLSLRWSRV